MPLARSLAPPAGRPLVLTADPLLLDDLLRLCAAAGVEPDHCADAGTARRAWASAPLVLVGGDAVGDVVRARLPRRDDVVLVSTEEDDVGVWERAVGIGAQRVAVLAIDEAWIVDRLADAVETSSAATVVSVVGGRGGAGASTTAVALALTWAVQGHRAVLVDGDPLGGGVDLVLGAEDLSGLRWPDVVGARGRVAAAALWEALPAVRGLGVLSWDRGDVLAATPEAMEAVLGAARRASSLVVIDLPRYVDAATAHALATSDVTLLVVPAEVRAVAAAGRVATAVGASARRVEVMVRGPAPSGLRAEAVAEVLGLPLAGTVAQEPGLALALERGEPPTRLGKGPLAEFCKAFLTRVTRDAEAAV